MMLGQSEFRRVGVCSGAFVEFRDGFVFGCAGIGHAGEALVGTCL